MLWNSAAVKMKMMLEGIYWNTLPTRDTYLQESPHETSAQVHIPLSILTRRPIRRLHMGLRGRDRGGSRLAYEHIPPGTRSTRWILVQKVWQLTTRNSFVATVSCLRRTRLPIQHLLRDYIAAASLRPSYPADAATVASDAAITPFPPGPNHTVNIEDLMSKRKIGENRDHLNVRLKQNYSIKRPLAIFFYIWRCFVKRVDNHGNCCRPSSKVSPQQSPPSNWQSALLQSGSQSLFPMNQRAHPGAHTTGKKDRNKSHIHKDRRTQGKHRQPWRRGKAQELRQCFGLFRPQGRQFFYHIRDCRYSGRSCGISQGLVPWDGLHTKNPHYAEYR
eukprot:284819359_6